MKTKQGIEFWMENGKYTVDGYDLFETLEDLEADVEWQLKWVAGEACKGADGWSEAA